MADHGNELEKISRRLKSIELRLERLESAIGEPAITNLFNPEPIIQPVNQTLNSETTDVDEKGLESQIGRFGLAWLGNIVLLFGITFLTQYLMTAGLRYFAIISGYIAAGSIFFLANYLKKTNDHLAFMFRINSLLILYYITLKLHFFSISPLISNITVSVIVLLLVVAFQIYLSIYNKSQAFAVLSVLFALTTAVLGDKTHFLLPLVTLTAIGAVYLFFRFEWKISLFLTIFLTYSAFLLWLFGNPFTGHPMQLISEQNNGVYYLFGLGACYSFILLLRKTDGSSNDFLIGVTFVNGFLFTFLLLLVVLRFYSKDYVSLFSIITVCCLLYSTVLHSRSDWNFASAFYALYGFMAMTIAIYGILGFPKVYLLLSIQSLLVVSMALWFRNRLIVVMNSLLFLLILAAYLLFSNHVSEVNFSFALISLISARIINWKRYRLQIKTDLIRNLYMITGFFMVLYALAHGVPKQFITFSWTIAALLYFLLSILLRNIKYRYMALGTMICAAFYLFIVDLASIELIYRVLSLLCLAAISIGISMYYTNRMKKPDN